MSDEASPESERQVRLPMQFRLKHCIVFFAAIAIVLAIVDLNPVSIEKLPGDDSQCLGPFKIEGKQVPTMVFAVAKSEWLGLGASVPFVLIGADETGIDLSMEISTRPHGVQTVCQIAKNEIEIVIGHLYYQMDTFEIEEECWFYCDQLGIWDSKPIGQCNAIYVDFEDETNSITFTPISTGILDVDGIHDTNTLKENALDWWHDNQDKVFAAVRNTKRNPATVRLQVDIQKNENGVREQSSQ